jgi:signal transduction histidine kinase
MPPLARDGLIALGIAAGYFVCIMLSMTFRFPDGWAIVWPARAFLITALMLLPQRKWWLIVAVVPAHFVTSMSFLPQAPPLSMATQLLGHLAVALASVLAIRRIVPAGRPFDGAASLFKYIVVVGIAIPATINLAIIGVHVATGWFGDLWQSWWQWMAAGFFVTITIPPLLVLLVQGGFSGRPQTSTSLRLEMALITAALFATSFVAFGGLIDTETWPAAYLAPLPLLLWAAARFGVGGTALALLAMASGVVIQTVRFHGPFAGQLAVEEVASLHIFLAAISAPLLLFAALMDERRRSADLLRRFEAAIQVAASSTDTGLWQWDALAPRLWLTANCRAMFALPEEDTNTPYDFLDAVHPEDRAVVGEALEKALTGGKQLPVLEFRLCSGGKTRWFVLQSRTACDEAGRPTSVSGVFRDISDRIESRLAVERLEDRLATLQDDERRRIAQELHDSTAQHLVGAQLHLLNLRTQLGEDKQGLVDEAYRSLREASAEIRTFTYLLHASQLEEEGLAAMLRLYVPGFERRTGLPTALRLCPRADELPGELQHALLRITQESLGNVQRHAGATRVAVDLRCFADSLHLVVRDDGKGIGPEESERLAERLRLALGLPGMTVRVRTSPRRIGGAARGQGTTIHVSVPMHSPGPASARGIANLARETLGAGRG